MKNKFNFLLKISVISALFINLFISGAFAAEKRVALLIGNAGYTDAALKNTINDVKIMETALLQCGFNVITGENLTNRQAVEKLRQFSSMVEKGSVALIYYSGHGVQYRGRNYLVPIGANIQKESDIEYECLDAARIIDELEIVNPRLKIIILDACRNNPFGKSFKRSISRGLATMKGESDTLIAYSTAPDDVASDGDGSNSPYAEALVKNMLTPGLDIEKVFKLTRSGVLEKTGNQQRPWETSSLVGDFFFKEKNSQEDKTPAGNESTMVKPPEPIGGEPSQKPQEQQTAEPASVRPIEPAPVETTIFSNGNIYGVDSDMRTVPYAPTEFNMSKPAFITYVDTYHYFNNGVKPGKISLIHEDGTIYGPWQASGISGQGGVKNATWVVKPNIEIKSGNYTVMDSHPRTWSFNRQSHGAGFTIIKGYYK